jgi:hypothetical protein
MAPQPRAKTTLNQHHITFLNGAAMAPLSFSSFLTFYFLKAPQMEARMKTKIAQKIHLSPTEKKHLDALSKSANLSLSDYVGKLIMQAAGRSKEASLSKMEAGLDYLVSLGEMIERTHINSTYNRTVLLQLFRDALTPEGQAKALEVWEAQKIKNGIAD